MADALHRGGNGLLVHDVPGGEVHLQTEPLRRHLPQHLQLDGAHELEADLAQPLVPQEVELGVLLLQGPELVQGRVGVHALGQQQPAAEHRLQLRRGPRSLRPQPLAGAGAGQAGDGADRPRLRAVHGPVLDSGVDPQLLRLLLPDLAALVQAGEELLHRQPAAGDLHIGEPVPLAVPADLVHPGPEVRRVGGPGAVLGQPLQELVHPLQPQGGPEPAGEQGPGGDEPGQGVPGEVPCVQVLRQGLLPGGGRLLQQGLPGPAEVHAPLPQLGPEGGEEGVPVRPRQIHLVDKEEHRQAVALQQPPEGAGVGLHAVRAADDQDGAVQHLEGALHLRGEVHVARGVQQRGLLLPQGEHRLLGVDGDAPLPLQLVRVQEGVPVVHPAQGPDAAGLI